MKKLIVLITTICLVFVLGAAVMAEGKMVYLEYQTEKDADNYGPTLGFDWEVNGRWALSLRHQFQGGGQNEATTSLGAEYTILENMAAALHYDTANSENSIGLEFSGGYPVSDPLALTGGISYSSYITKPDTSGNYSELELSAGLEYQVTDALLTTLSYVWTNTRFIDNLLDQTEGGSMNKFVAGAEYSFDNCAAYLEYEIPKEGYTITIGVSYHL
jgi:predicted porin